MIPIVNNKYRYILFYSAKAGSTSSRLLYLLLHGDEFTEQQLEELNEYHNLNELQRYDPESDYSDYTKFLITRNPYSRAVSAYLDQYVYAQNTRVKRMLSEHPPSGAMPNNFIEFLEYLETVPDSERDTHFQTQAHFTPVSRVIVKDNWFIRRSAQYLDLTLLKLDLFSDIKGFKQFTRSVYAQVFKSNPDMQAKVERKITEIKKSNSSFYGPDDFADAGLLPVAELDKMTFSPKPQDFYRSKRAQCLVEKIYAADFRLFDYALGDLPHKDASAEVELMPTNFDWQAYIEFNSDLSSSGVVDQRTAVRHYLEFGRFEPRAFSRETPAGFDWRRYIELHDDLKAAGIETEHAAVGHYLSYGIREDREF